MANTNSRRTRDTSEKVTDHLANAAFLNGGMLKPISYQDRGRNFLPGMKKVLQNSPSNSIGASYFPFKNRSNVNTVLTSSNSLGSTARQSLASRPPLRSNIKFTKRGMPLSEGFNNFLTLSTVRNHKYSNRTTESGNYLTESAILPEEVKIDFVLTGSGKTVTSETNRFFYEPLQLLRTPGNVAGKHNYATGLAGSVNDTIRTGGGRELVEMCTVRVPKTGAIKLTGVTYEMGSPLIYDDRRKPKIWKEQEHLQKESVSSHLLNSSWEANKGRLTTSKGMIKQLRKVEKGFMDELNKEEQQHKYQSLLLKTSIGGLLMFKMPELPTLSNNIQQFVEANTNYNKARTVEDDTMKNMVGKKDSNPDPVPYTAKQLNGTFNDCGNLDEHNRLSVNLLKTAKPNLENLKQPSVKNVNHRQAVYDLWHSSENSSEDITNFHQVLAKAQRITLSCNNKFS